VTYWLTVCCAFHQSCQADAGNTEKVAAASCLIIYNSPVMPLYATLSWRLERGVSVNSFHAMHKKSRLQDPTVYGSHLFTHNRSTCFPVYATAFQQ
jgi:hypothetical protein